MFTDEKIIDEVKCEVRVFDSLAEMTRDSLAREPTINMDVYLCDKKFVGRTFDSWESCQAAVNRYWPEGFKMLDSLTEEVGDIDVPVPQCRSRRSFYNEEDGNEIDYDRLRDGSNWWRGTKRVQRTGPTSLTMSVDVASNCYVTPRDLMWRGMTAIILTEVLEAAGYRVELWMHDHGVNVYTDGAGILYTACLKQMSEPLDRSTLVNGISGWFFRTIGFRQNASSDNWRRSRSSLGSRRRVPQEEIAILTREPDTIVVDNIDGPNGAEAFIKSTLKRFA